MFRKLQSAWMSTLSLKDGHGTQAALPQKPASHWIYWSLMVLEELYHDSKYNRARWRSMPPPPSPPGRLEEND